MSITDVNVLVLFSMIFMHTIADFRTQGILTSMKSIKWWKNNYPDKLYQYDWIMSLFIHAFQWTFMITIPGVIYWIIYSEFNLAYYLILVVVNTIIHMLIDHSKANLNNINLIIDQICHILQIIGSFIVFVN
jgi:hypothetical protein